jgi:hypothetical protein
VDEALLILMEAYENKYKKAPNPDEQAGFQARVRS